MKFNLSINIQKRERSTYSYPKIRLGSIYFFYSCSASFFLSSNNPFAAEVNKSRPLSSKNFSLPKGSNESGVGSLIDGGKVSAWDGFVWDVGGVLALWVKRYAHAWGMHGSRDVSPSKKGSQGHGRRLWGTKPGDEEAREMGRAWNLLATHHTMHGRWQEGVFYV